MSVDADGTRTAGPVSFPFVVGCGRSGTTLVRAMLDSHPQMAVPAETKFIVTMGKMRRRYETPNGLVLEPFIADLYRYTDLEARWGLPMSDVAGILAARHPVDYPDAVRGIFALMARRAGKPRYGNKTPKHVLSIPLLSRMFPEAVFIHVIRDGRDVALSFLEKEFGPSTVSEAAQQWKRLVTRGRRDGGRLARGRYHEIRYEDLVADPERELRAVSDFLLLDYDPRMLAYHRRAEEVRSGIRLPHNFAGISLPPTPGLRDWRTQMETRDLGSFEAIAGTLLDALGYERSVATRRPVAIAAARGRVAADEVRRLAGAVGRRRRRSRRAASNARMLRSGGSRS